MPVINFHHDSRQISDSTPVALLLALSGGFLDAYTYIGRGGVFANAQTGNIVLVGMNAARGNWTQAFFCFLPILAFACGVFLTEAVKSRFKESKKIHWRQVILLIECGILALAAFVPENMNSIANIMISFVCSFQVDAFRKWHGHPFATTMCTGNLRTGSELIFSGTRKKERPLFIRGLVYYIIILVFILGAAAGCLLTKALGLHTLLFALLPIFISLFLMFIREGK